MMGRTETQIDGKMTNAVMSEAWMNFRLKGASSFCILRVSPLFAVCI